jgi:hypothetical protein
MPSPTGSVAPAPPAVPPDSPLAGFEEAGFDDAALSDAGASAEPSVFGNGWPATEDPLDGSDGSYGAEPLHDDTGGAEALTPPEATTPRDALAAGVPGQTADDAEEPWDPGTSPEFGTIDIGGDDANATALPIPADDPAPPPAPAEVAWTEPPPAADALDLSDLRGPTPTRTSRGRPPILWSSTPRAPRPRIWRRISPSPCPPRYGRRRTGSRCSASWRKRRRRSSRAPAG